MEVHEGTDAVPATGRGTSAVERWRAHQPMSPRQGLGTAAGHWGAQQVVSRQDGGAWRQGLVHRGHAEGTGAGMTLMDAAASNKDVKRECLLEPEACQQRHPTVTAIFHQRHMQQYDVCSLQVTERSTVLQYCSGASTAHQVAGAAQEPINWRWCQMQVVTTPGEVVSDPQRCAAGKPAAPPAKPQQHSRQVARLCQNLAAVKNKTVCAKGSTPLWKHSTEDAEQQAEWYQTLQASARQCCGTAVGLGAGLGSVLEAPRVSLS